MAAAVTAVAGGRCFQGNVMHPCFLAQKLKVLFVRVCVVGRCQRPVGRVQKNTVESRRWGRPPHHFFSFNSRGLGCPENRPWFPGTMQLMRMSPRKIRLWHHGFLKCAAEPTTPACCNQASVNFHCKKGKEKEENLFSDFFFSNSANALAWGCTFLEACRPVCLCRCFSVVADFDKNLVQQSKVLEKSPPPPLLFFFFHQSGESTSPIKQRRPNLQLAKIRARVVKRTTRSLKKTIVCLVQVCEDWWADCVSGASKGPTELASLGEPDCLNTRRSMGPGSGSFQDQTTSFLPPGEISTQRWTTVVFLQDSVYPSHVDMCFCSTSVFTFDKWVVPRGCGRRPDLPAPQCLLS